MLGRDALAALLPHAGAMCLLDAVESYDGERIVCTTMQHRNRDNPLAVDGRLGCAQGIELAAQAMAIHGALVASSPADGRPSVGWLASVRNCVLHRDRIDTHAGPLRVSATRVAAAGGALMYGFAIDAGPVRVIAGTATVVLGDPAG
jgi:predicted hotdog family 3-hydroxylacyl-ACP dehydratase